MQKIRFIDLFSGIGGMRLAFESAAHSLNLETECVLSSEINPDAQLVYQTNFCDKPSGDIRLIDQLPEHQILLAGFPCQSFNHQQLSLFYPLSQPVTVGDILEDNPDAKYDCSPEFVKALKQIVNQNLNR